MEKCSGVTAVIGGGPAGLMAAELLAQGGVDVHLFDAMPSVGRKFLIAGRGGLNLTHSEPYEQFLTRYGTRRPQIEPLLNQFGPDDLRQWVHNLGFETFVGTSGRVFPADMKAAPLLRAWLARLRLAGVNFYVRHRWLGWNESGALRFATPDGEKLVQAEATILALGGGSWAKLGSDGTWVSLLAERGVPIAPLRPANSGFDVGWSDTFRQRFAGQPVKSVILTFTNTQGKTFQRQGEFVITATGVEGSLIYAASALLRDEIEAAGSATFYLDLSPNRSQHWLADKLARPRGSRSFSSHLQSRIGLKGVKVGLLREVLPTAVFDDPGQLAAVVKALPVRVVAVRPLDEAISSAGGVMFEALDERLMIRNLPGIFCAGEMLDWEAPTGGYLLTACFASGRVAAQGMLVWLADGVRT
ncbi:MAG: TIGR03862 family flavoprotein [Ardenticatenaceae bacterium]|nr:TIGR03862 family flavoprotein [Ardenticatenaceae bacterium]MCB9445801.1 TIGR03862 family flavoprotein [Ardenticatenaceae bacterium]